MPLSAGQVQPDADRLRADAGGRAGEARRRAGDHGSGGRRGHPELALQLGSLGSGNHFIEVTADEQDRVWLFLHSGTRGVGNKIAHAAHRDRPQRAERERLDLPDRDLA